MKKRKKSLVGWTYNEWFLKWRKNNHGYASRVFKRKQDVIGNENFPVQEPYPKKIKVTFEEL
jgi:hypothetical protein